MAKVLITGGAGRLGRNCAHEFTAHGHEIGLLDRRQPEEEVAALAAPDSIWTGELWDGHTVENAIAAFGPEVVVHLGANPGPSDHPKRRQTRGQYAEVPRDDTFKSNVLGTYYVLDAAVRHGVKKVVAASSYFVLGLGNRISDDPWPLEYLPIDEDHPMRPEDTYSLSKLLNEEMYQAYSRAYGLQTVAFRLMGVYYHESEPPEQRFRERPDPPQDNRSMGADVWCYVDGRDAAHGFRLAAEAEGLAPFEAFYLVTDRKIRESPRAWLARYYPHLMSKVRDLGEFDNLVSDEKARRLLGYEPQHSWLVEFADRVPASAPGA